MGVFTFCKLIELVLRLSKKRWYNALFTTALYVFFFVVAAITTPVVIFYVVVTYYTLVRYGSRPRPCWATPVYKNAWRCVCAFVYLHFRYLPSTSAWGIVLGALESTGGANHGGTQLNAANHALVIIALLCSVVRRRLLY